jgi:hypothetical protein
MIIPPSISETVQPTEEPRDDSAQSESHKPEDEKRGAMEIKGFDGMITARIRGNNEPAKTTRSPRR